MSSSTARHLTPPAPPAERDPLVRGPVWLELGFALAYALPTAAALLWAVNAYVYLSDRTPRLGYVAAFVALLFAVLGVVTLAYVAAMLTASWCAAGVVRTELAARWMWAHRPGVTR